MGVTLSEFSTLTLLGADEARQDASSRIPGVVHSIGISLDGSTLGCVGTDGGVWATSIEPAPSGDGQSFGVPRLLTEARFDGAVALDHEGQRLVAFTENSAYVWSLKDNRLLGTQHLEADKQWNPQSFFGAADRDYNAIPMEDNWQFVASLPSGEVRLVGGELKIELRWIHGDQVIAAVEDLFPETPTSRVELWHVTNDRVLAFQKGEVEVVDPVAAKQVATVMPFGPGGRCRMAGNRFVMWLGRQARLYDAVSGALLRRFEVESLILDAIPVPGTESIVVLDRCSAVAGVDLESLAATSSELELSGKTPSVQVSKFGLTSVIDESGAIRMVDARSGRSWPIREPDGRSVLGSRLSPDGKRLVALVAPNALLLYDTANGQVLARHLVARTEATGSAESWVRMGHTHFDATGEVLLVALSVIIDGSGSHPRYGPDRYTVMNAVTGESQPSIPGPDGSARRVRLVGNGDHLLVSDHGSFRLFDIGAKDLHETFHAERATVIQESQVTAELIVMRTVARDDSSVRQVAAVDIEQANIIRVLAEASQLGHGYDRHPTDRFLCLDEGKLWLNAETGSAITGTATLLDGDDEPWPVAFGPDGLVLLNGCQLGRIAADQFQRIGRRHWVPLLPGWNERAKRGPRGGASFLGDERALVGAFAGQGGLYPVVLDFGPATNEPMQGAPNELLKAWCERLDLKLSNDGQVLPTHGR